ncbi:metallophosphoesterase family protein [Salinigranum halophilum]|uniref:metallophosphoesterase family protein n=1 Tax=Salinigranum halophilum TaxID=2565931 RepID=UPI00115ED244
MTTLGWVSDSHIGKRTGGYGRKRWALHPEEDLVRVVRPLCDPAPAAVIHTGDVFHEDSSGVTPQNRSLVREVLERFAQTDVPVLYIRGNHARQESSIVLRRFERAGLLTRLQHVPTEIGSVAVYGIDYHDKEWWSESVPRLQPSDAPTSVLCLHQSLRPYVTHTRALSVHELLQRLSQNLRRPPDVVLVGHMHRLIDDMIEIDGHTTRVLSCGATTRIGKSRDSFGPSRGELQFVDGQIHYQRISEPAN